MTQQLSFDGLSSFTGTPTNKGATTYNGQSVVAIDRGSKSGTVYVAATGTPYPVAIVSPGRSFTFDSRNKPVTLTPPPWGGRPVGTGRLAERSVTRRRRGTF